MPAANSFDARAELTLAGRQFQIYRLGVLAGSFDLARLPFSLKILLENLLRFEDGRSVTCEDIAALAGWQPGVRSSKEIAYRPARVLLQDFTGVPCVVDLAAMRDAIADFGGDPKRINPLQPVELVIDHSVQVDAWASPDAFEKNADLAVGRVEFGRGNRRHGVVSRVFQALIENQRGNQRRHAERDAEHDQGGAVPAQPEIAQTQRAKNGKHG